MKTNIILAFTALVAFAAIPVFAHDGHTQGAGDPATPAAKTLSTTPAHDEAQKYTCPMHPEVISDKPGKCPKCGMTLVPVKGQPAK